MAAFTLALSVMVNFCSVNLEYTHLVDRHLLDFCLKSLATF